MRYEQRDSAAWWLAEKFKKDPGEIMISHIKRLRSQQTSRYDNFKRLMAAYEFGPRNANRDLKDDAPLRDKIVSFNFARNGVDTMHAKICKGRTLPMCMTTGGGPLQRSRAKDMEKGIHGEMRKNHVEELEEQAYLDGLVCGIGFAHVLHGRETLTIDWAPADDMLVDEAETRYKRPRSIYRRLLIDRYVLLDNYGASEEDFFGSKQNRISKIRRAKAGDMAQGTYDELGNQVEVWLGWHLQSGEEAEDGKYCVAIDGATLEFVPWERPNFPFAIYVPAPRTRQLHGLSVMQDFLPIQEEHDKVTERIQRSNHLLGGTHLMAARQANVDRRELNNGQGTVIEYDAEAGPDCVRELHPSIANEQVFRYEESLITKMYQLKGIPQMTAMATIPPELAGASGKALQVAEEAVDEKLLIPLRAKDRFIVNLAWLIVDEARAMVEDNPKYSVKYKGERKGLEKINWKKVLLDHEEFDLDVYPVNAFSKSPTALFAQLTELLNAKAITTEQFRRLYGIPDLEAENDVDLSDLEVIDRTMDKIVIEGKPLLPESFDYLTLILQRGRKFYNMCRNKEVPEERLALLRDYLERADTMNKTQIAALAPQNQAGAGMPQPAVSNAAAAPPQNGAAPAAA